MKHFVIGAGAHANEIMEQLSQKFPNKVKILSLEQEMDQLNCDDAFQNCYYIGIGFPEIRLKVIERWRQHINVFPELVSNSSNISPSAKLSNACVVEFGAVVSSHSFIDIGVLINWNSTVGHDVVIGKGSVISPNASVSGGCLIHEGVLIGTGARILPHIEIGKNAIIGAGAVVTKNVEENATMIGIPARRKYNAK